MSRNFSVSMCVYGGDDPRWFREAVDSLLNQTCVPAQIVLVVDGPVPPALNEAVEDCEKQPVFKVIRLPENKGHGYARRVSFENCDHELIAIMDADDLCLPHRFEKQLAVFEKDPQVAIAGGQMSEFLDEPDNVVGYRRVSLTHEEICRDLKGRCPMNQVTVMMKKTPIEQVGGYQDWYCNEDYYLWVRAFANGLRFANVPEVLVNVRVGADMYQRRGGWKYFRSEQKLQSYMRRQGIIGMGTWLVNVTKRLIVQVLLPNRLRSWVFKTFAREQTEG